MICYRDDLEQIVRQIQEADFTTATPTQLQAMGGLLRAFDGFVPDTNALLSAWIHAVEVRFSHAATLEEQSRWLEVLLHVTSEEHLFAGIFDETEYCTLQEQKERVLKHWRVDTETWANETSLSWAKRPLAERLHQLWIFYQQDIHLFDGGDDSRTFALMELAAGRFEQCRKELFLSPDDLCTFLSYYHVLCLARPNYRNPNHQCYYKQYFRCFDALLGDVAPNSEQEWQAREVAWHDRLQSEHHYDLSLLSGLSVIDSVACASFRCQCYQWMLNLDPEDDGSIQELYDHQYFAREGIKRIRAWLNAKERASISIPPEAEAEALLTLCCAKKILFASPDLDRWMEERLDALLPQLPPSKLKAHLLTHLGLDTEDESYFSEVDTLLNNETAAPLSEEDHYLLQLYQPVEAEKL